MVILCMQMEVKFLVMFELELDSQRGSHFYLEFDRKISRGPCRVTAFA